MKVRARFTARRVIRGISFEGPNWSGFYMRGHGGAAWSAGGFSDCLKGHKYRLDLQRRMDLL
jgi:hypothetical protein